MFTTIAVTQVDLLNCHLLQLLLLSIVECTIDDNYRQLNLLSMDCIVTLNAAVSKLSFIPRCHSSLSCINEYLATDRGGYWNEYSLCSNCGVAESFAGKLKWPWNEQVCLGVKCKVL